MNKQTKIIEHHKLEQLKYGKPEINPKSREMASSDKNRVHIFERVTNKKGLFGTLTAPKKELPEVDEDKKRESRERIKEFLDRNYQRHMQKQAMIAKEKT